MAELLSTLSEALVQAVETVGTSVVTVRARRRLPATGIVWDPDGVIVTASHVVEREAEIRVSLPDGQTVPAKLVGRDDGADLAVLRAEARRLTAPKWAAVDDLYVGALVLALGRPGGMPLATLGILSALDEAWRTPAGGHLERYVQTDAVMYPGFSGGPLVDTERRVIGLNTSALVRGLNLTVPAPSVRQSVETLLAHGKVRRGYLGVGAQAVRLPDALRQQLGQERGLLLMMVKRHSPADRGGLLLGDILISLDGKPLHTPDDLLTLLNGNHVGAAAAIRLVRGGEVRELKVTVGERSR